MNICSTFPKCGIYKITSPSNSVYIGQSWNILNRFKSYKRYRCKDQRKIYSSLVKYGIESHIFEIIHELPCDISQDIIDKYENFYWQSYIDCGIETMNLKEPKGNGKFSGESRKRVSLSKMKPITQFSKDGIFIKHWRSAQDAGDQLGICSPGIRTSAKNSNKTASGFLWKSGHLPKETIIDIPKRKKVLNRKARKLNCRLRYPVYQYDLEGNLLKEFNNASEAAEEMGVGINTMNYCLLSKNRILRKHKNYTWVRIIDLT